jgi:hypothetical protein
VFDRLQQPELADRDRSPFLLSLAGRWGSYGDEHGRDDKQPERSRAETSMTATAQMRV